LLSTGKIEVLLLPVLLFSSRLDFCVYVCMHIHLYTHTYLQAYMHALIIVHRYMLGIHSRTQANNLTLYSPDFVFMIVTWKMIAELFFFRKNKKILKKIDDSRHLWRAWS
jgi:hypothetical protein